MFASRNGLVIAVAYGAVSLLGIGLSLTVGEQYVPVDGSLDAVPDGDPSVFVTVVGQSLSTLFVSLLTVPIGIIAIRIFVGNATDRIPDRYLFHRTGRATVTGFGLWIVEGVLVVAAFFGPLLIGIGAVFAFDLSAPISVVLVAGGGLLAIILSGILLLHFVFTMHEVAVRDCRLRGALRQSWATVRRDRLRIGLFAVSVYLVTGLVGAASGVPFSFDGPVSLLTVVGFIGSAALSGVANAAWIALMARAYANLRPDAAQDGVAGDRAQQGNPLAIDADTGESAG